MIKSQKTRSLDIGIKYVQKKISTEEIIRKLLEIDKMKFLIFDENTLNDLNLLSGPNLFYDEEKNFTKKFRNKNNNKILNNKSIDRDSQKLNNFWNKFEFENDIEEKPLNINPRKISKFLK